MNYAGFMRCKNESRWIARVLQSIMPLCQRTYFLDDNSTDDTREIASSFPGVQVIRSPFTGLDEVRDKEHLLQAARNDGWANYLVAIDGDEELEPQGPDKIRRLCENQQPLAAHFQVIYLWDKEDQWRSDGLFQRFMRPSLFTTRGTVSKYVGTTMNGNLHCCNIPAGLIPYSVNTDIKLLHWGWFDRELRMKKYKYYNEVDPGNAAEDEYIHAIIGDPGGPPADAVTRHAGPLKLEPLHL